MSRSPEFGRPQGPSLRQWRNEADDIIAAERSRLSGQRVGEAIERVVEAGSRDEWQAYMAQQRDSSATMICSDNADLFLLIHAYGSGRAMDAWVTSLPSRGLLQLDLIIAPAWPKGGRGPDALVQFKRWATTNIYATRVELPSGGRSVGRFTVGGEAVHDAENGVQTTPEHKQPCFASVLHLGNFHIGRYGNAIVRIEAWPEGSAGVRGYVERRSTNLHL